MMSTAEIVTGEELVQVPVPRKHLHAVYRALADAMAAESNSKPAASPGAAAQDAAKTGARPWTREDIQRLKGMLENETARALLDLAARNPGERITFQDVKNQTGRMHGQSRADLGGFSKLIRREFGRENWPLRVEIRPNQPVKYSMDDEIAGWWRES